MPRNDQEYKVFVEVDGVVYRGRYSVNQDGKRVYIDGKLVGVEVDNNGEPLTASPLPVTASPSWWRRITSKARIKQEVDEVLARTRRRP
jgi:hypothetical protein